MDASPKGASDATPTIDHGARAVRPFRRRGRAPPGRGRPQRDPARAATSRWRLLARQLASPLIWLLLAAAAVSAVAGRGRGRGRDRAIVVLNALVGFFQEYRAENALLALRSMTAPRARVVRDGQRVEIAAARRGPGRRAGARGGRRRRRRRAPASRRTCCRRTRPPLTGESVPVEKAHDARAPPTRRWPSGTTASSWARRSRPGPGRAEVIATGHGDRARQDRAPARDRAGRRRRRCRRGWRASSRTLLFLCLGIVAVVAVARARARAAAAGGVPVRGVARGRGRARGAARDRHHRARGRRAAHGARATCSCAGCRRSRRWAARRSSAPTRPAR